MKHTARTRLGHIASMALGLLLTIPHIVRGETCTTQSQMQPSDRNALAAAATSLASRIQAADASGLRALSVAEVAQDFAAVSDVVAATAPKLKDATLTVDQVYLLDATTLKLPAGSTAADAQFYCILNKSANEADFLIPALPPGRYAFAIIEAAGTSSSWRLSFLFRQEQGKWLMAGLYPKPRTAAGHDGVWYWTEARQMVARKQPWSAWLYLQQAQTLLQPAGFVQSTHLEKLRAEITSLAPPALSEGVTPDAPLVVKAKDGTEFRFTSLATDDSLSASSLDVAVHLKADALADQAAARKRNIAAMSALLSAYPELRQPFHGVWVFADVPNQPAYATELAVAEIP